MDLPDVLAIAAGVSVVVGGSIGMLVGGPAVRGVIDDGQRGSFAGLWVGTIIGFLIYFAQTVG